MSLLLASFLSGFAVLTIEVLGVHWLAPWFGTSTLIWLNQIGIVLFALAVGGWLGAVRTRTSPHPVRLAGMLLVAAGALTAFDIVALPWFAQWVIPEQMALEEAAGVFLGGSLASALLFFAPPVLVLGMVTPLLVEARAEQRGAGGAAGELAAAGTIGSLLGVFGTTWVGIPILGTRLMVAVAALALVAAGLALVRVPKPALAAALLTLVPAFLPDAAREANLPPGVAGQETVVLAIEETPYQRLRVVEFGDGTRWLQMNEGLDSFQSIWRPGEDWPGGYYDLFALAPLYARYESPDRAADEPVRFWSLGFGGGAALGPISRVLDEREWHAVGVELDPGVSRLIEEWMPLPEELAARVQVVSGADARPMLRAAPTDLDFVLLDAYARQFEIPLHLATEEFFVEVASRLRPGGVFAVNLGTIEQLDDPGPFLGAIAQGLESVFGSNLRVHRVPFGRNLMAFARKDAGFPPSAAFEELLPAGLPVELGAACLPGQFRDAPIAGEAFASFRDDRNPLALAQAKEWQEGWW